MKDTAPVPVWRLDDLDPKERSEELYTLRSFIEWLNANGVTAPACWYAHGWMRHRLAAMLAWWIHVSDGKEAAAWWGEVQNITQSAAWREALDHGKTHVDASTGARVRYRSFDDAVRELCAPPTEDTAA